MDGFVLMALRSSRRSVSWLIGLILLVAAVVWAILIDSEILAPTLSVRNSPIISASGTQLYLHGSPYHFIGVNAYEAGTEWGTNAGCGTE
jgi:hypothetical protein